MILASIPQLLWRSGFSDVLRWPFQKYFFGNVSRVDVLCGRAPGFSGHVPQTGLAGLGRTQATLRERLRSAWRGCSGLNALQVQEASSSLASSPKIWFYCFYRSVGYTKNVYKSFEVISLFPSVRNFLSLPCKPVLGSVGFLSADRQIWNSIRL